MIKTIKTNARNKFMQKVEAGKLAGRLHRYVMAKESDDDYADKFMTNAQVSAANILLKKVVPDVKYVEVDAKVYEGDPNTVSAEELDRLIYRRLNQDASVQVKGKAKPGRVRKVH